MEIKIQAAYNAIMGERLDRLLTDVRKWCKYKRGRQSQLAKHLGVHRQTLYSWLINNPKNRPSAEQALELAAFIESNKRKQS